MSFSQAELEGTIDSQGKCPAYIYKVHATVHDFPDGKSGLEMSLRYRQKKFFKV